MIPTKFSCFYEDIFDFNEINDISVLKKSKKIAKYQYSAFENKVWIHSNDI